MPKLMYLSYGPGIHEQGLIFSLYSALRWGPPAERGYEVVIYTDRPRTFDSLPATLRLVSAQELSEWAGPTRFIYRRKILALADALRGSAAPTILIDADTYFVGNPASLFSRIRRGQTMMHIREGRVGSLAPNSEFTQLVRQHRFQDRAGAAIPASPDSPQWNAGVVGMHPDDAPLLDDVLHLSDALCQRTSDRTAEQLAFSIILSAKTRVVKASDMIVHYWPPYIRRPFESRLPQILEQSAKLPPEQRYDWLYSQRPQPTLPRRGKVLFKRAAKRLGLLPARVASREW
jgi:hypothetical protein